jgi:hypothetical protein
MNKKVVNILSLLCSIGLALVFAAAAAPKLLNPDAFSLAIYRYQLLPHSLVNLLAIYLPWLELCSAAFILWPRYRDAAAMLALGMLVMFTAAIGISMARGIDVSCGCFTLSADAHQLGWTNVLRNVALLAAAAWVLFVSRRQTQAGNGTLSI